MLGGMAGQVHNPPERQGGTAAQRPSHWIPRRRQGAEKPSFFAVGVTSARVALPAEDDGGTREAFVLGGRALFRVEGNQGGAGGGGRPVGAKSAAGVKGPGRGLCLWVGDWVDFGFEEGRWAIFERARPRFRGGCLWGP